MGWLTSDTAGYEQLGKEDDVEQERPSRVGQWASTFFYFGLLWPPLAAALLGYLRTDIQFTI